MQKPKEESKRERDLKGESEYGWRKLAKNKSRFPPSPKREIGQGAEEKISLQTPKGLDREQSHWLCFFLLYKSDFKLFWIQ